MYTKYILHPSVNFCSLFYDAIINSNYIATTSSVIRQLGMTLKFLIIT